MLLPLLMDPLGLVVICMGGEKFMVYLEAIVKKLSEILRRKMVLRRG